MTTNSPAIRAAKPNKRAGRDSTARTIRVRLDHISAQRVEALRTYLDAHSDCRPTTSVALRWAVRFAADFALGDPAKPGAKPLLQRLIDAAAAGD